MTQALRGKTNAGQTAAQLERQRANDLRDAVVQFNIKAKNGIQRLVDTEIISAASPEEIAFFMYNTEGLSKRRIGEFLGKNDTLSAQTLVAYLRFFDFSNKQLDEALRVFLVKFRLPGEAQQIDRLMEQFAGRFYECNPTSFDNEDVCYVLAFSLIMLNTDLHNPNISADKKMKLDGFIRNNRGINNGGDLDQAVLSDMFNRIKTREIRMEDADLFESEVVTFIGARRAGWLQKSGSSLLSSWKKYWFVLNDHCLYCFASPHDQEPRRIIPLTSAQVNANGKRDLIISKIDGTPLNSVKIVDGRSELGTAHRLVLRAAREDERRLWYSDLNKECQDDPTHARVHTNSSAARPSVPPTIDRPEHEPLDADLRALPPPLAEGWMKKRGADHISSELRRRYFVLCDVPQAGMGVVLFYYGSREMAQKMKDTGSQTQKGHIDLRNVRRVHVNQDPSQAQTEPLLELVTVDRIWQLVPENGREFDQWFKTLRQVVEHGGMTGSNGAAADDSTPAPPAVPPPAPPPPEAAISPLPHITLESIPPSPSVAMQESQMAGSLPKNDSTLM